MTVKRIVLTLASSAGLVLALLAVLAAQSGVNAPAAAAGATPPALPPGIPPIPTAAPRGPTVPAATYANGTVIPTGGYTTTTNGTPIAALPNGPFTAPSGIPAITPTIANAGPSTPAFTTQDATTYVTGHDVGAKVHATGAVTVVKVSFLLNRDSGTLFGTKLPLADDRLLCVVQVSGTVTVGVPGGGASATLPGAYEVFDAHTGNQLATIA